MSHPGRKRRRPPWNKTTVANVGKRERPWDLKVILATLNNHYFPHSPVRCRIAWSRSKRTDETIDTQAWCYREKRLIVIHCAFKHLAVPDCVIEWLVWHEMCHLLIQDDVDHFAEEHTDRFCELERAYDGFAKAIQWWEYNWEYITW
jgi:hypothetical protein